MAQTPRKRKTDPYSELTDDSIRCRINGHIWRPVNAEKVIGAFQTEEGCERCRSSRISIIGNRGDVRSRRIVYAEHYLARGGHLDSSDRDAMRLQVLHWDFKV